MSANHGYGATVISTYFHTTGKASPSIFRMTTIDVLGLINYCTLTAQRIVSISTWHGWYMYYVWNTYVTPFPFKFERTFQIPGRSHVLAVICTETPLLVCVFFYVLYRKCLALAGLPIYSWCLLKISDYQWIELLKNYFHLSFFKDGFLYFDTYKRYKIFFFHIIYGKRNAYFFPSIFFNTNWTHKTWGSNIQ